MNGLDMVTSKEVYHRICKIRPDLTGIQQLQQILTHNSFWNNFVLEDNPIQWHILFDQIRNFTMPKLLIHIPMRQYWLDELNGLEDLDQLKLLVIAGSGGHFQLFQHLYNKIVLDQHEPSQDTSTSTSTSTSSNLILSRVLSLTMYAAVDAGHLDTIQFILTKLDTDNTNDWPDIELNYIEPRKPILPPSFTTETIYRAFAKGRLDIIKLLLPLPNNDPTLTNYQQFIVNAVLLNFEVVKFLLLEIPGVNVLGISIHALFHASNFGYIDAVKFLLSTFPDISTYSTVNPKRKYIDAIEAAAYHGRLEVLKLLLKHNENIGNLDMALIKASEGGHLEIAKYLMNLVPGIHVAAHNNMAIKSAAKNQRFDNCGDIWRFGYYKCFVGWEGVNPTACNNEAIRRAATGGHEEVVKFLLEFPGVY
ncbi:hypothetical protein HDU76_002816 [Blyttiomyces sp. JEL0837]|nr:hypothetical protein HDU76_002816 [Blyttiomyces sp. JEL0837]